jgi:hypothetical protein
VGTAVHHNLQLTQQVQFQSRAHDPAIMSDSAENGE